VAVAIAQPHLIQTVLEMIRRQLTPTSLGFPTSSLSRLTHAVECAHDQL
jgi:hypothetical protein